MTTPHAERLILSTANGPRQEFTLSKAAITIGRSMTNDVAVRDPLVSRVHARVERTALGCEIVDLGSANGVTVNGVPIARVPLKAGDVVTIGESTLVFQA